MVIQVLVAAFEESIRQVPRLVASLPHGTPVLIVHQVPSGSRFDYDRIFTGPNIEVVPFPERGLAVSRNRAAALATGDIVIPTDADVTFLPDALGHVHHAFGTLPDPMVVTFQARTPDNQPYKTYHGLPYRHSLGTIRRVSSIEIALRRDALMTSLRWDTRFGINARYPGGLELAFMKNVLEHGLSAYYYPEPIVVHPRDSTGHRHSPESALFRGAIYARLYGAWALPLLLPFALRNAWRTGSPAGAARYVGNLYRGACDFLLGDKPGKSDFR